MRGKSGEPDKWLQAGSPYYGDIFWIDNRLSFVGASMLQVYSILTDKLVIYLNIIYRRQYNKTRTAMS